MPSYIKRTLCLAGVSCAAVASDAAARKDKYVPTPGYTCTVGRAYEDKVWITRKLDEAGKQYSATMEWRGQRDLWQPSVSALWTIQGDRALDINDGSVFIDWSLKIEPKAKPRPRMSSELTTRVRNWPWPNALLVNDGRWSTTLTVAWSDIRAYARGADRFFIVLRDRKKATVLAQAPIAPSLFADGEAAIVAALTKLDQMSADYRTQCSHVSDIVEGDIIVT